MPSPGVALKMTKIHLKYKLKYIHLVSCLLAINITVNTVVEFQTREVKTSELISNKLSV